MVKTTNEIVVMFWEDGEQIGYLHQNGHPKFFKSGFASKETVSHFLNADLKEEKPKVEEK